MGARKSGVPSSIRFPILIPVVKLKNHATIFHLFTSIHKKSTMKQEIKMVIFFLSLTIFLFSGCEDKMLPDIVQYERELIFKINKTYYSNDEQLKFVINEVSDSRCPKDVWCVWQGEAIVQIISELPEIDTIELSTYDNLLDTIGNFSFELIEVSPYPVFPDSIRQEDYKIKMKIKELYEGWWRILFKRHVQPVF